jgi:hypothetical protein
MTGSTKMHIEYCETSSLTDKCQHRGNDRERNGTDKLLNHAAQVQKIICDGEYYL